MNRADFSHQHHKTAPIYITIAQLKPCVGTYLIGKVRFKVVIENNALVSIDARNNKTVLAAKQRKISL